MRASKRLAAILSLIGTSACALGDTALLLDEDSGDQPNLGESEIAGQTLDYFTNTMLPGVSVDTLGLAPERLVVSGRDGFYEVTEVPAASSFFLRASAGANHLPTITSEVVSPEQDSKTVAAPVVSVADRDRQNVTAGQAVVPGTSTVIIELVDFDDTPLDALPQSDISLLSRDGDLIATEPFFFGAVGDINPALLASEVHGGAARAAFLNVPAGLHTVVVTCSSCDPLIESLQTVLVTTDGGVSLARIHAEVPTVGEPSSFETVYAVLGRYENGGRGCAVCHTALGPSELILDDGEAAVLARLRSENLIDLATPADSAILRRPLFEIPADHPNATWFSEADIDYQRIRAWIAAGAK